MNQPKTHKKCNTCNETKEIAEFQKWGKSPNGRQKYSPDCKSCTKKKKNTPNHQNQLGMINAPQTPQQGQFDIIGRPNTDREFFFWDKMNSALIAGEALKAENKSLEEKNRTLQNQNDKLEREIKNLKADHEISIRKSELEQTSGLNGIMQSNPELLPQLIQQGVGLLGTLMQTKGLAGTGATPTPKHAGPNVEKLAHVVLNEATDPAAEYILNWIAKPDTQEALKLYIQQKATKNDNEKI